MARMVNIITTARVAPAMSIGSIPFDMRVPVCAHGHDVVASATMRPRESPAKP